MNQLIPVQTNDDDKQLAALSKLSQNDFPGFLKVMNGTSTEVGDEKANAGELILKKQEDVTNLGKEFDAIPLGFRMTATTYIDDQYHAFHSPESEAYSQVEERSSSKDPETKMANKHGPEFLLWIPSLKCFATLHLNTWSNWPAAKAIKAGMGHLITISSLKKSNPKFKWFVFDADMSVNDVSSVALPDEDVTDMVEKFNNAPDYVPSANKEKAETDGQAR
jgi:hypothetical protein